VFIDETIDYALYVNILANTPGKLRKIMGVKGFIFQQNNDPKHTSKLETTYFREKDFCAFVASTIA